MVDWICPFGGQVMFQILLFAFSNEIVVQVCYIELCISLYYYGTPSRTEA